MLPRPAAILVDFGGTLVEEVAFDTRAGLEALIAHAEPPPSARTIAALIQRADLVSRDVAARRDQFHIETPWVALTRLIHYPLGIRFTRPLADLELPFWNACAMTRPMPGARDALAQFAGAGVPVGLVGNSSFAASVLCHELAKHGLDEFLSVALTSADYAVRKPNPLLFTSAAALLGVPCERIWFIGDRADTDVAGARAAQMHPIQYDPSPAHSDASPTRYTWADVVTLWQSCANGDVSLRG